MSMTCRLTGNWTTVSMILKKLPVNLYPIAKATFEENGQMVLEKFQGHIDSQDLDWESLSPITVQRKGSSQVYFETGTLRNDGFKVVKMSESSNNVHLFIGAPSDMIHSPSGLPMSKLLLYLEYGTTSDDGGQHIPPRPIVRPTWAEVEPLIKANMGKMLKELMKG